MPKPGIMQNSLEFSGFETGSSVWRSPKSQLSYLGRWLAWQKYIFIPRPFSVDTTKDVNAELPSFVSMYIDAPTCITEAAPSNKQWRKEIAELEKKGSCWDQGWFRNLPVLRVWIVISSRILQICIQSGPLSTSLLFEWIDYLSERSLRS